MEMRSNIVHDRIWTLIYAIIGAIAGIFVVSYQVAMMSPDVVATLPARYQLMLTGAIQVAVYAALSAFFGFKLARRTGLDVPFDRQLHTVAVALLTGLASAFIIVTADKWVFMPLIPVLQPPEGVQYTLSPVYLGMGVLYGGIIEELLMRLFLMSLVVYLLSKLASRIRREQPSTIPAWIYWMAIGIVALLFAAGHLPATAAMIGLSPMIVLRSFVLNGIAGFLFGLLFWKKGLTAAMIAHASTHLFNQLVLMPLLF
jgi:large-conductance mechanosensitive channel